MNFESLMEQVWQHPDDAKRLEHLRELIQSARNSHGDSLLHLAAAERNEKAVQILIKLGCDPNCQNHFGSPPIDVAAWKGDKVIVEMLLNAGANIGLTDSTGSTVLDNLSYVGKADFASWIQSRLHNESPETCREG